MFWYFANFQHASLQQELKKNGITGKGTFTVQQVMCQTYMNMRWWSVAVSSLCEGWSAEVVLDYNKVQTPVAQTDIKKIPQMLENPLNNRNISIKVSSMLKRLD